MSELNGFILREIADVLNRLDLRLEAMMTEEQREQFEIRIAHPEDLGKAVEVAPGHIVWKWNRDP